MVNGVKIYALDQLICLVVLGFMCLAGGLWPLANRNILLFSVLIGCLLFDSCAVINGVKILALER